MIIVTKTDKLFEIITWPMVFLGVAGVLFLVGINIYFIIEVILNLTSPLVVFIGSMLKLSVTGAIFLILLYIMSEMDD